MNAGQISSQRLEATEVLQKATENTIDRAYEQ